MRKILTLLIAFSLFSNSYGQGETFFNNSIDVSLGFAIPKLNFAKTDLDDTLSGFGKNGGAFKIQYNHTWSSGFGVYANYRMASIGVNEGALKREGVKKIGGANTKNTFMTSKNYQINALNFGIQYTINRNHKFHITPRFGLGVSSCKNRYVEAEFSNGLVKGTWEFKDDISSSLNINTGLEFGYQITEKIILSLAFESQLQAPTFAYRDRLYWNNIVIKDVNKDRVFPMLFGSRLLSVQIKI